jgi:hypothetical protein
VVREARGLVLDYKNDWQLVGRSFRRFLNAGEHRPDDIKFNWDSVVLGTEKVDGSLINLHYFNNQWNITTRGSFADGQVNDSILTWTDLFKLAWDFTKADLNPEYTYVLELCSLYNKIVRHYVTPQVFLLTVFMGEQELTWETTQQIAIELGIQTPETLEFTDISKAQMHIAARAENDATYEGVVIRDVFNNRLKVKSDKYLHLHRLANNGQVASLKSIVNLIMLGEVDETLVYFPELEYVIRSAEGKIEKFYREIDNVWWTYKELDSQQKFAKSIIRDTKFTAPLFSARKRGGEPKDYVDADYLLKFLFNKD